MKEESVGAGEGAALALTAEGLQQRSEWPRTLHSLVQAHRAGGEKIKELDLWKMQSTG